MDLVNFLVAMKVERISLPAVIALCTLEQRCTKEDPFMYIGEAHAFFHDNAKKMGLTNTSKWSYPAVGRMLNVVTNRGLAIKERDGHYVKFTISEKGKGLLQRIYGAEATSAKVEPLRLVQ